MLIFNYGIMERGPIQCNGVTLLSLNPFNNRKTSTNSFFRYFSLISCTLPGTDEMAFASTRRFLKVSSQNLTRVDLQD